MFSAVKIRAIDGACHVGGEHVPAPRDPRVFKDAGGRLERAARSARNSCGARWRRAHGRRLFALRTVAFRLFNAGAYAWMQQENRACPAGPAQRAAMIEPSVQTGASVDEIGASQ
jgi:hypothetical protein